MSAAPAEAPPLAVAVAVVVRDPTTVSATLAAVRRQVYEPVRIVVVGGDRAGRRAADDAGVEWVSNVPGLLGGLDGATTHVWLLHSGVEPRPDALRALLVESERVDAAIAGSKLLDLVEPERLVSVGIATDVFDSPYTGLDEGEVDHGQYDVVRDVAAVAGPSMLVRRDLARGLGGPDPLLAPGAAAIDLCQRARLRGGRVVVVPSSEVLVPPAGDGDWREDAGEVRAMLKVYSPLTLFWVLPIRFLLGLLEGIVAPFLGRWTLFGWAKAWTWNLVHLSSTIRSRMTTRHHRVAGDTELFRFQLRGSADLRRLGGETGARLRERLPGDDRLSLLELGRDLRQPAFVVGAFALAFAAMATRTLWNGFPAVGFSLPLPDSGIDLAEAYAGGWNPAGFGSVEPLPPLLGLAGVVQTLAFGDPELASGILLSGAFLAGVWGIVRLLRTWGIEAVPGTLAGLVLMAGPVGRAIAADTGLGTLIALGALPWALRVPLARPARTVWGRIGRVAAAAWVTGLVALGSPLLLPVPLAALLLLAVITPTERGPWRAVGVSAAATVLALPLLLPWIAHADLKAFAAAGEAYWEPGWFLVVALGAACVTALVSAPKRLAQISGWGAVIAAAGAVIARTGDYGPGREAELGGMAIAALGTAVVCGVAFEVVRQVRLVTGWRRLVAGLGLVGAAALVVSTGLVLAPGRAGLPGDVLDDAMGFTAAAEGDPTASRVLLVGPADTLPGDAREIQGAGYRVVSAPMPALWEAWLPDEGVADAALAGELDQLIAGESFRAGEDLAQFGIRWVIFMGESPLGGVFAGQLDMVPLQGLDRLTFSSEAASPVRARTDDGATWRLEGTGYVGEPDPSTRVLIAEEANSRWQPDWRQAGWANELSAGDGVVDLAPIRERRIQAGIALGLFTVLVVLSGWGRRRR